MKIIGKNSKLLRGAVALSAVATLALLAANSSSVWAATHTTEHLIAKTCGTWNDAGQHTVGVYNIGHSIEHPQRTSAYFVFDLTPVQGRKVVAATLTIPGTRDFSITDIWPNHTPAHQFKVGIAPLNVATNTVEEVMNGNNDLLLYINNADVNRNHDLGYGWIRDGLHPGFAFDSDHFLTERLQAAVNKGGLFALWASERFDFGNTGENYIWGGSSFNTGIVLNISVQ